MLIDEVFSKASLVRYMPLAIFSRPKIGWCDAARHASIRHASVLSHYHAKEAKAQEESPKQQ